MKKIFNFCFEVEFYLKIAISCTIVQQTFYWLLHNIELNFINFATLQKILAENTFETS